MCDEILLEKLIELSEQILVRLESIDNTLKLIQQVQCNPDILKSLDEVLNEK